MFLALIALHDINIAMLLPLAVIIYATSLTVLGGPKPKEIINLFLPEKPPISEP
jgi:hypothetical protein